MSFKIGDRVKLITDKWEDGKHNPLWGGECGKVVGTVIKTMNTNYQDFAYNIKWDNGGLNSYHIDDVVSFECEDWKNVQPNILPEELFEL